MQVDEVCCSKSIQPNQPVLYVLASEKSETMKQIKNVFSVFDGMSCLQQALNRSRIRFERYYASEIDKHAIKVTQANYPETIQLGSIININPDDFENIDFFAGGSPCQSFSFAGKRKGMSTKDEIEITTLEQYLQLKSEGFEFEGQSYLFWEYMRLLTAFRKKNPNIKFLLENVMMGEKWEKILTRAIGVNPIEINSALVSAQNRRRLYWTNIGMEPGGLFGDPVSIIKQPKGRGILLRDILEPEVSDKYFLSEKFLSQLKEKKGLNIKSPDDKSNCFTAGGNSGGLHSDMTLILQGCVRFGRTTEAKKIRSENLKKGFDHTPFAEKEIIGIDPDKMNTLTTGSSKDNLILQVNQSTESGGKQPYQQNRVYDSDGISPALCANKSDLLIQVGQLNTSYESNGRVYSSSGKSKCINSGSNGGGEAGQRTGIYLHDSKIRRLTPIECERLQTVPDNYTNHVSDTQRYRMLGNGWTIDVIVHLLSYL